MKLLRDRLNNAAQSPSAIASMIVVNALQDFPPEQQMVGLAAAFLLMCEAHGLTPQDAYTVTKNCINDADNKLIPEFRAVRAYVRNEL